MMFKKVVCLHISFNNNELLSYTHITYAIASKWLFSFHQPVFVILNSKIYFSTFCLFQVRHELSIAFSRIYSGMFKNLNL